ncbi:MAG: hypothetical protein Aurels2KO_44900 [Aureliella sp.]
MPAQRVLAQSEESFEETTWAIAAQWLDDETVIATTTAGLHYQPSQLIRASLADLDAAEVIGTGEASMWTAVPLGKSILATDYKGGIHLFDSNSDQPTKVEAESRWIRASAKLPDGNVLLGTQDGKVLLLGSKELSIVKTAALHESAIFDISLSSDGTQFATATETGEVGLFAVDDMKEVAKWSAGTQSVWGVAFAGSQIVTAGADRQIKVWDPEIKKLIVAITTLDNWGSSVVSIPDTSLAIVGSLGGSVTLVDAATLYPVATEQVADSGIWSLSISPNGQNLLAATRKHGLKVIDISTWPKVAQAAAAKAKATMPPVPK